MVDDVGVLTRYFVQDGRVHGIRRISTGLGNRKRSMFAGNTIVAGMDILESVITCLDGMVYVVTPEDILFHLLPHIQKSTRHHSVPLQDIIDSLPSTLQIVSSSVIQLICECTASNNSFVPDTYKFSASRTLHVLRKKVEALVPVLGSSIQAEFVEKKISTVLGHSIPTNMDQIRLLAQTKCAVEIVSENLDEHCATLLLQSYEYRLPIFMARS